MSRIPRPSVDKIDRVDGIEVMTVKASLEKDVLASDMVREIRAYLEQNPMDPAVNVVFRGSNEEQEDSQAFLLVAMLLALFLMFILFAVQQLLPGAADTVCGGYVHRWGATWFAYLPVSIRHRSDRDWNRRLGRHRCKQ